MSFVLPNPDDPADPGLPAPLFADVDAVRGDQLRACMQLIWGNFAYLDANFGSAAKAAALAALLTGFVSGSDAAIADTDTILQAFAKAQGQISPLKSAAVRAEWRANTYAGYGATDTKIPYFTNVVTNVDTLSAITVVNNATNGCRITINTAGKYAFSFNFNGPASTYLRVGLSLNSSQLTTSIGAITVADVLAVAGGVTAGDTIMPFCGWSGYLAAGSVVRPHTDGNVPSVSRDVNFTVSKMG